MSGFAVAFSTSSPRASVALFSLDGRLIWNDERPSEMAAAHVCLELLDEGLREGKLSMADATVFLADLGPGSFSGVRVGVMLAKTFAFASGGRAGGASAFDLISTDRDVFVPARKGEYFLREPGREPARMSDPSENAVGYRSEGGDYPAASGFGKLWARIELMAPELLMPEYVLEPSISSPKQPYGALGG